MKLAIMQPYFFPYIGYIQLINAVDKFVVYDDVNFIRGGWIARNRYIVNGKANYFSVPLRSASPFSKINETSIDREQYERWKGKFFKTLRHNYSRAPYFGDTMRIIEQACDSGLERIDLLAKLSLRLVCDYLDISTEFVDSSTIYENSMLRGVERVIDICLKENAGTYRNLSGGKKLYSASQFAEKGILLQFINTFEVEYKQFSDGFIPSLSILDVMMFNSKERIREMLKSHDWT